MVNCIQLVMSSVLIIWFQAPDTIWSKNAVFKLKKYHFLVLAKINSLTMFSVFQSTKLRKNLQNKKFVSVTL